MPQYVDRTKPLEEQIHRLFERHEARKRKERMTEEQFETLKHWIEAVVYSAISDPDGNSNGKLYRVQEDRARELLTEVMPRYAEPNKWVKNGSELPSPITIPGNTVRHCLPFETYLFEYPYLGQRWSLEIKATSPEDAEARFKALLWGEYKGVLVHSVEVKEGGFWDRLGRWLMGVK